MTGWKAIPNFTILPISSWLPPLLDGGHKYYIQLRLRQPVQCFELVPQQVFATQCLARLGRETVELKVDGGFDVRQARQEAVVPRNAYPVGVEHSDLDTLVERHAQHREDLGVDSGVTPTELDHLGVALELDEPVQHTLDLLHREAELRPRVGEADGTIEVVVAVDLDDSQARVLLVLRTQSAIL